MAQIALEKGFDTVDNASLALLTDTIYSFVEDVALTIKSNTEHSGRTESNLIDALHGLLQYDLTEEEIAEFISYKKEKNINFHERIILLM